MRPKRSINNTIRLLGILPTRQEVTWDVVQLQQRRAIAGVAATRVGGAYQVPLQLAAARCS